MSSWQIYSGICTMAVVTYVIRMIPMVFFSRPVHSRFFRSFLYYVPYAVLSAMTFPGVFSSSLSTAACSLGVLAALICAWSGGSLLQVAAVSAAAAWVSGLIFPA